MDGSMMKKSLCGVDCEGCFMKNDCRGCEKTGGHPFGGDCPAASCIKNGGCLSELKEKLISEFNAITVPDMDKVTELYLLKGSFINLDYPLPNGGTVRFWKDDDIYFGTQLPKKRTARCYGLATDGRTFVVSEYGEGGVEPKLILFWNRKVED